MLRLVYFIPRTYGNIESLDSNHWSETDSLKDGQFWNMFAVQLVIDVLYFSGDIVTEINDSLREVRGRGGGSGGEGKMARPLASVKKEMAIARPRGVKGESREEGRDAETGEIGEEMTTGETLVMEIGWLYGLL